jgi:thioredoxin reductase (NADPH)
MRTDVLVIGAGPTGLACAIEAQKIGLRVIVVDKGCLVNSLFHYPAGMTFFTTPELLEIGDIPFTTSLQKPTREEALEYYRKVAEHYSVDLRQYEWVKMVLGEDGDFKISGDCGPGFVEARGASQPGPSRGPAASSCEVLDQA